MRYVVLAELEELKAIANWSRHVIETKHEASVQRILYNFPESEGLPVKKYQ